MNKLRVYAVPLVIFVLLVGSYLPLISKINFTQNDDFYYYNNVSRFLAHNFTLVDKTAPTFYTQGLLGMVFSLIFEIGKLPTLTLFISVLNIVIIFEILRKIAKVEVVWSVLLSLTLFFCPLYQYALYGFMTETYLLFFLLLLMYQLFQYETVGLRANYLLYLLFLVLALLVRQVSLIVPAAYSIYLFLKGRYKEAFRELLVFLTLVALYLFLFPKTPEMTKKVLQFQHALKAEYAFAVVYGIYLYLVAFFVPFFIVVLMKVKDFSRKKFIMWAVLSISLFYVLNAYYQPMKVSWGEFPYFENTFERTGFIPRVLDGTKYIFKGSYDLYKYWELAAKVLGVCVLSFLVLCIKEYKKFVNINVLLAFCYVGLMVLTYTFYDRYIVFLLIPAVFLLAPALTRSTNLAFKLAAGAFVAFLALFNYVLGNDFVLSHSSMWNEARNLVATGVAPKDIYMTTSWNKEFTANKQNAKYIFSYDSQIVNQVYKDNYLLVKTIKPLFVLDPFISPRIYLYQKKL